jgi:hypothetical protein
MLLNYNIYRGFSYPPSIFKSWVSLVSYNIFSTSLSLLMMLISRLFVYFYHVRRYFRDRIFTSNNKEFLSFTSGNGFLVFVHLQSRPCSCAALPSLSFLRSCRSSLLCLRRSTHSSSWTKVFQYLSKYSWVSVIEITKLYN